MQAIAARQEGRALWLLRYDDELYFILKLILEGPSLLSNHASFAESLYGLRRVPSSTPNEQTCRPLRYQHRALSLFFLVSHQTSVAVLAEMSLRSPRKSFIFIIKKYICRVKVSKKQII